MADKFKAIPPACKECKEKLPWSELVMVNGRSLCVACVNKTVPGGVKNIWSQQI